MLLISKHDRGGSNLYTVSFYGARHNKIFDNWSSRPMIWDRAIRLRQRIERRRKHVINARIDATGQVNKVCSRCGREFWLDAMLAPKRAFDRCGLDDCRASVEVIILDTPRTAAQQAAFEDLSRRVYARAMSDLAPAA